MAGKKIFVDHDYQTSAFLVNPKVHTVSDISSHAGVEGQIASAGGNLFFNDGSAYFALIESNYSGNLTGTPNWNPSSGTVPFTVESGKTGKVENLNADLLDGYDTSTTAVASKIPVYGSSGVLKVGTPAADGDAATKLYVDNAIEGLDVKDSVKAASTANLTLSGTQTVDGVSLSAGDRILVKNQSTASENGIYVVASGAWSLADDSDSGSLSEGAYVFVEDGTVSGSTSWVYTDSSAYTWAKFSGAGQIEAGSGLVKSGETLSANVAAPISIASDAITIADAAIGGAKLANNTVTSTQLADEIQVTKIGIGVAPDSGTGVVNVSGGGLLLASSSHSDSGTDLNIWTDSSDYANYAGKRHYFYTGADSSRSNHALFIGDGKVGINNRVATLQALEVAGSTLLTNNNAHYVLTSGGSQCSVVGLNSSDNLTVGQDNANNANTYIYGGTGAVNLSTGGSDRLTVASGGDVKVHERLGVGVTPDSTLHVADNSYPTCRIENTTNASTTKLDLRAEEDAVLIRSTGDHPMRFDVNQTERMRLNTSGLGIGKTPTTALDVYGAAAISGHLDVGLTFSAGGDSDFGGNIETEITKGIGSSRFFPVLGGAQYKSTSTKTGYLRVSLPVDWPTSMVQFHIDVYDYGSQKSRSFCCAGYAVSGSPGQWTNTSFYFSGGNNSNTTYRCDFDHDGTTPAIYISKGTSGGSSSWSYPQIVARDLKVGYSGFSHGNWVDGWSVGFATSLPTGNVGSTNYQTAALPAGVVNSTDNYVPKFTSSGTTVTDSLLYDSGTHIGLGTEAPEALLHVSKSSSGSIGGQIVIDNPANSAVGNTAELSFLTDTGASGSGTRNARILAVNENASNGAANMQFHTWNGSASAERMRIKNTGEVGIGTNDPQSVLHVYSAASAMVRLQAATGNNDIGVDFFNGNDRKWQIRNDGSSSSLYIIPAGESDSESALTVTSNSYVGIGTNSPSNAKLVINNGSTSSPVNNIELIGSSITDGGGCGIFFKASTASTLDRFGCRIHSVRNSTGGGGAADLVFSNEAASGGGLNQTMVLKYDGKVGIGTNTPDNLLTVSGNVSVTGNIELEGASSGYIFASNNEILAGQDAGGYYYATGNGSNSTLNITVGHKNNQIRFRTGSAGAERLKIDSAGAVKATRDGGSTLMQVARVYDGSLTGTGSATTFTVTHNLESQKVIASVIDDSTGVVVEALVTITTDNALTVTFNSAPASGKAYRVPVIG